MNSLTIYINETNWDVQICFNTDDQEINRLAPLSLYLSTTHESLELKHINENAWITTAAIENRILKSLIINTKEIKLQKINEPSMSIEINQFNIGNKNINLEKIKTYYKEIPEEPVMAQECIKLYSGMLRSCKTLIEYGSGGSTIFASKHHVDNIISAESDINWLLSLLLKFQDTKSKSKIIPTYTNIGQTGSWGSPIDQTGFKGYPLYSTAPWAAAFNAKLSPDLVLIDGRFRVSCFLTSLILAKPGCIFVFEDYTNRPQYHIIETLIKPFLTIEPQSCFIRPEDFDLSLAYKLSMEFCLNPE